MSRDGGRTWTTQFNQPTAETLRVDVDNQFPYRVYGAQQDNTTVIVPSQCAILVARPTTRSAVLDAGRRLRDGTGETEPDNPQVVYGVCKGEFQPPNLATGQDAALLGVSPEPLRARPKDIRYRFQRTRRSRSPRTIRGSSTITSQFVHRTRDEGVPGK